MFASGVSISSPLLFLSFTSARLRGLVLSLPRKCCLPPPFAFRLIDASLSPWFFRSFCAGEGAPRTLLVPAATVAAAAFWRGAGRGGRRGQRESSIRAAVVGLDVVLPAYVPVAWMLRQFAVRVIRDFEYGAHFAVIDLNYVLCCSGCGVSRARAADGPQCDARPAARTAF
jgi:hypothetical protein